MKCQCIDSHEQPCENEARYVDEFGQLVCGTCPIKYGADAIKIGDVPALLQWARDVLAGGFMNGSSFEALRAIVGVKPEPVIWPLDSEETLDEDSP